MYPKFCNVSISFVSVWVVCQLGTNSGFIIHWIYSRFNVYSGFSGLLLALCRMVWDWAKVCSDQPTVWWLGDGDQVAGRAALPGAPADRVPGQHQGLEHPGLRGRRGTQQASRPYPARPHDLTLRIPRTGRPQGYTGLKTRVFQEKKPNPPWFYGFFGSLIFFSRDFIVIFGFFYFEFFSLFILSI